MSLSRPIQCRHKPSQLHPAWQEVVGSHHPHTQDSARCRGKAPPTGILGQWRASASCPHCQQVPQQDSVPTQSQGHSCTPGASCGVPVQVALRGTVCIIQGARIPPSFPLGLLQPLQIDCRKAGTCRAPQVEDCGCQWLLLPPGAQLAALLWELHGGMGSSPLSVPEHQQRSAPCHL